MATKPKRRRKSPEAEHQAPPVESHRLPVEDRGDGIEYVVPGDERRRVVYVRQKLTMCPQCRRVRMDDRSRACVVRTAPGTVAYMRCRCCSKNFSAPIE